MADQGESWFNLKGDHVRIRESGQVGNQVSHWFITLNTIHAADTPDAAHRQASVYELTEMVYGVARTQTHPSHCVLEHLKSGGPF